MNNISYANDNVYNITFKSLLKNTDIKLSDYKGKVILIVNTASKCGFASQFKDLQSLNDQYKDRGLIIIGTPSDNFLSQEFDNSKEIHNFCSMNFGVNFLMSELIDVKGKDSHEFYKYIKKTLNITPKWNFYKFLINRQGEAVYYFSSIINPMSNSVLKHIEELLNQKA